MSTPKPPSHAPIARPRRTPHRAPPSRAPISPSTHLVHPAHPPTVSPPPLLARSQVLLDLSQNVHMTDLINRAGVTSCLTPGGQMFHLKRGREISGYEKLLLSGIPADSLLLGGESEVQLSDLAGNAMSMPVVSACMLAALCILPYSKRKADGRIDLIKDKKTADPETGKMGKQTYRATFAALSASSASIASETKACKAAGGKKAAAQRKAGSKAAQASSSLALDDCKPFSFASIAHLADRAERSSVLCTCESSGDTSKFAIMRCASCTLTTCALCAAQLQLGSHSMVTIQASANERFSGCGYGGDAATAPDDVEKELRRSVPDVLHFATPVEGVGVGAFRLTRVERGRGLFTLRYVQYHASEGTASAVLSVSIGRFEASGTHGVKAVLFDLSTGQRGPLTPVARLRVPYNQASVPCNQACVPCNQASGGGGASSSSSSALRAPVVPWEVTEPCETTLEFRAVVEAGFTKSYRSEMGLIDFGDEVWPLRIQVSGKGGGTGADLLAGTYTREACRGAMAFGALWRRETEGTSARPAGADGGMNSGMWLFIDPDVDRTASDRLIFATSPTYLDGCGHQVAELMLHEEEPVLEWLHELGQRANGTASSSNSLPSNAKAAGKKKHKAAWCGTSVTVVARLMQWEEQASIALYEPISGPVVEQTPHEGVSHGKAEPCKGHAKGQSSGAGGAGGPSYPSFVVSGLPASTLSKLGEHQSDGGQLSILSASSTVAERRLAESLAAPLLRHSLATVSGQAQRVASEPAWGECEVSAPRRPPERWSAEGKRTYETEDSNAYEKAMSERPPTWDVRIRIGGGADGSAAANHVVVSPQPAIAAHQAAEKLLRRRGLDERTRGALQIDWTVGARLDAVRAVPVFPIPTSKADLPSDQPPALAWGPGLLLYPRQLRVKRWMEDIENGVVHFDERECTDAQLPGVGWTLQAKATIHSALRGGVLADALGAGKTVTVIALIAADIEKARGVKLSSSGAGKHLSRASLIVVTPLIIRQWEAEIERFSGGKLKCLRIESAAQLQDKSVKQLREADVVLVVSDLLGCAGKAVKYAKAVDAGDAGAQTSKEAEKEARRALERLEGQDRHEALKLAKSLDERQDTYLDLLTTSAGTAELPPFLHRRNGNRESGIGDNETTIYGVWLTKSSRDPYGKVKGRQEDREAAAYFSHSYARVALPALRAKTFKDSDKGVPIEYFRWRVRS